MIVLIIDQQSDGATIITGKNLNNVADTLTRKHVILNHPGIWEKGGPVSPGPERSH
mgnify:CR=1 FL=1